MGVSFDIERMRKVLHRRRFEWRKHAIQRLAERRIPQARVLEVLRIGKIVDDYPEDKPYPSALFMGTAETKQLHVVVAYDQTDDWVYVITAYEPDQRIFEADFITRRKK